MKPKFNISSRASWPHPLIAGPCSAEGELQVLTTAKMLKATGRNFVFRAGIWKPRTRPGSFEGVGKKGLPWLQEVKKITGFPVATEVATAQHVEDCLAHGIDILWIGARTTVNPFSVQEIANALRGTGKTIMVKNPVSPDLQLWIGAIERINRAGISKLAAIHRGFQSPDSHPFRNAPLWNMVVDLKSFCPELPIICDPSHICGARELIPYIAQRSMDMDMDGLMIESHCNPAIALSDAAQQLSPDALHTLLACLVQRSANIPLNGSADMLEKLRQRINGVDEEIIRKLSERQAVASSIGELKKEKRMTILQMNRWEEMLESRIMHAEMMGLNRDFMGKLYRLIHEESIRRQTEIMNDTKVIKQSS